MNRLDFYTGGHPFSTDDITFLQTALRDALRNLTPAVGGANSFILSGCEVTVGTGTNPTTYTAGWAVHQGEILYVPAGTVVADSTDLAAPWLEAYEEPDTSLSPRTYADAASRNVHIKRQGRIVNTPDKTVDAIELNGLMRFDVDTWNGATITGINCSDSFNPVGFRRMGDKIELKGRIDVTPAAASIASVLFTIPAGKHRPSVVKKRPVATSAGPMQIKIDTNGEVKLEGSAASPFVSEIYLDGVYFHYDFA